MNNIFARTEALLGKNSVNKLKNARVALFGLGGVGSSAFEALVRSGVGTIEVFDCDTVSETNLNRQLLAVRSTIGISKTSAAVERAADICADTVVIPHNMFYLPNNSDSVDMKRFDVVIDAVDTVTAKLEIIQKAKLAETEVLSCMGTGNKLDITRLRVSDISETSGCPLARIMRKELKSRNIEGVRVVWSDEKPYAAELTGELKGSRPAPASAIFVPSAAGMLLAMEAIKIITRE